MMKCWSSVALWLVVANANAAAQTVHSRRTNIYECTPQILYFEVWDAHTQAPTGEIINSNDMDVCFPSSTQANIEAVATDCTRRVLMELTRPDGSTFNRNEGKEPYLVFGDHLFEDPPRVNGRYFQESGAYSISAYPKNDPSTVLTYTFNVKFCEMPTEPPTKHPTTQSPSTEPPVITKPPSSEENDCIPTQGVCASNYSDLYSILRIVDPYKTVAICDGATIDTSDKAPISIDQNNIILCCAGSNCVFQNNGSGRNLVVTGASASLIGIEFVGGVGPGDGFESDGGNVYWSSRAEISQNNNIINCIFRDGTTSGTGGNLKAEFFYPEITMTTEKSTFVGGKSVGDGGGVFITDTKDVFIRDCNFTGNTAGTSFDNSYGGGLMIASDLGNIPTLEILNTVFNDNIKGAIGVLADYDITFSGNSGGGNTPHGTTDCKDVFGPFGCLLLSDELLPEPPTWCASSRDQLQTLLNAADPYDSVAICDGATIDTTGTNNHITIEQKGLTLFCAGSNCVVKNNGGRYTSGRNLVVNGASTSIIGIEFEGGTDPQFGTENDGGNVLWKGIHSQGDDNINNIIDCVFRDGTANGYGGNLYVLLPDGGDQPTINIENSIFVGGKANGYGGGVFITGGTDFFVSIVGCNFTGNTAINNGGGGLAILKGLADMVKLEILNTVFNDNGNGAVAVPIRSADLEINFFGNSGEGNTPHGFRIDCTDLALGPYGSICVLLSEELLL